MPTIHTTRPSEPKTDPHLQAAGERVKAAAEELERLGIADKSMWIFSAYCFKIEGSLFYRITIRHAGL